MSQFPEREVMVKSIQENFLGKVCTVLTENCSLPFKTALDHSKYFSGILVGVDISGVWLKHPLYKTLAFLSFPIQGIVEEQSVEKDDPRYEKIKEELSKKEKNIPKSVQDSNSVINVDEISARIRASKKS